MKIFSVDAESDGLYGDIWAIGACVIQPGTITANPPVFRGQLDPQVVSDTWVQENIVPVVNLPRYESSEDLLNAFWEFWLQHRSDSVCLGDFGAPVEAWLFRSAIELDRSARMWQGPYPMHELGTALLLAGVNPDVNRREYAEQRHLIQHNPVDDAYAAAMCWLRATTNGAWR